MASRSRLFGLDAEAPPPVSGGEICPNLKEESCPTKAGMKGEAGRPVRAMEVDLRRSRTEVSPCKRAEQRTLFIPLEDTHFPALFRPFAAALSPGCSRAKRWERPHGEPEDPRSCRSTCSPSTGSVHRDEVTTFSSSPCVSHGNPFPKTAQACLPGPPAPSGLRASCAIK